MLTAGEGYISFLDNGLLVPVTSRDTAQAADGDIYFITPTDAATNDYTIKVRFRKKWADV